MSTDKQLVLLLRELITKSNGENGHVIIDDNYSGSHNFKAVVVLIAGNLSYLEKFTGTSVSNLVVSNKDAIYGNLTNVRISTGATAIGYLA